MSHEPADTAARRPPINPIRTERSAFLRGCGSTIMRTRSPARRANYSSASALYCSLIISHIRARTRPRCTERVEGTLLSPRVLSSLSFLFLVSGASVLELCRIKASHSTTVSAEVVRVFSGVMITSRWWSRCLSHTVKPASGEIEECRFCTI